MAKPEPPFFQKEKVLIMPAIKRDIKMVGKKNAKVSKTNIVCFDAKQQV
jgi:hypothetical protein